MILKISKTFLLFIFYWQSFSLCEENPLNPTQVHLSYGENESSIVVTWSTLDENAESIVEYGIEKLISRNTGKADKFIDQGRDKRVQYIHRVTLINLRPDAKYMYRCGSSQKWSDQFWFRTTPNSATQSLSLAFYGDFGYENAAILKYVMGDVIEGIYDAIFHIGDFAYDMHTENGLIGDRFMNMIQPIAAHVPYMVCAGNHETAYNFSHYKARFSMPSTSENLWYSFNMGPVHFIGLSSEVYYERSIILNGYQLIIDQYEWLEYDLKEATKIENRKIRPWIVTFTHRPMYCSNWDYFAAEFECWPVWPYAPVRSGILGKYGLEVLLHKYNVDIIIAGHQHSYQRLWPTYDYSVKCDSCSYDRYINPRAPVHIVTGAAGNHEHNDKFWPVNPIWSPFKSIDYSYTRLKVWNGTHLNFQQISASQNGKAIDDFWVIKYQQISN